MATRSYSAGTFALEVEGQFAGYLVGLEGGSVHAPVVEEPARTDGVVPKHLGQPAYDDPVVTCGVPTGPLADWLVAFLDGQAPAHDGAIVVLNYNYQVTRKLEFRHATIAAVTFPRLDGSSKEPAHLTVTIRPESTRDVAASGSGKLQTGKVTKAWQSSSFAVAIPGVDCTRVSSVAPLTVSQTQAGDAVGETREPARRIAPLDVGDLVVTVAESGASGFTAWRDDFIVRGNNGRGQEKDATLTFLAPNLRDPLMTLRLTGVGIHRLDRSPQVRGVESVARLSAAMYCEEVDLVLPQPTAPAPPAAPAPPPVPAPPPEPGRERGAVDAERLWDGGRRLDPALVARRLRDTGATPQVDSETDRQRQWGAQVGAAWAGRIGSLDELTEVASAARGDDWTSILLPDSHSLVEALRTAGVVPVEHEGGLELSRDSFVEGLVRGAASTFDEVKHQLDLPDSDVT